LTARRTRQFLEHRVAETDSSLRACEQALRLKPDFELARNNLLFARKMTKAPAK
jgi:hypothetical protein